MTLVSIIVPVYNTELYLNDCIQSVLRQSYTKWELLLIDDGSTDSSPKICDEYTKKDKRIFTVHKKNTGVSSTRNVALSIAKGDYIIFLDSDDFWCNDSALNNLVLTAEKYALDIVRGEYKRVDKEGFDIKNTNKVPHDIQYSYKILDSYQFLKYVIKNEFFGVLSLFKSKILKSIRFDENVIFMEDVIFYLNICTQSIRCMYLPDTVFYAYRQNISSATNNTNIKKLRDSLYIGLAAKKIYEYAPNINMKNYLFQICLDRYRSTIKWLSFDNYYAKHIQFISTYKVETRRKEIINWAKRNSKHISLLCFYIHPIWMVKLYRCWFILSKLKNSIRCSTQL